MSKKTLLIVGLGNPGEKYAHTRHNAGFEVMGRLEKEYGVKLRRKFLLQGMTAEVMDGETKIVLCEPLTYMNRSGECVKRHLEFDRIANRKFNNSMNRCPFGETTRCRPFYVVYFAISVDEESNHTIVSYCCVG